MSQSLLIDSECADESSVGDPASDGDDSLTGDSYQVNGTKSGSSISGLQLDDFKLLSSSGLSRPKYRRIEDELLSDNEKEKLNQRRERNKAAAARCRNRRRETISRLEKEAEEWETKVTELKGGIEKLTKQRDQLEFLLQVHNATCSLINDPLPSQRLELLSTGQSSSNPPRAASANHVLSSPTNQITLPPLSDVVSKNDGKTQSNEDDDLLTAKQLAQLSSAVEGSKLKILVLGQSRETPEMKKQSTSNTNPKPLTLDLNLANGDSDSRTSKSSSTSNEESSKLPSAKNFSLPLITTPVTPPDSGAGAIDTPILGMAPFLADTPAKFTPSTPLFGSGSSNNSRLNFQVSPLGGFSTGAAWYKKLLGAGAVLGSGAAVTAGVVHAEGFEIHPPHYHWNHKGPLEQLDMKSVRRGYEVYKQVCSACHAMKYMYYRNLVNQTHTEDEAKAEAAAITVEDEDPDEAGNPVMRPGKLADRFPAPYPNENAARAANNGAYPPDLSLIINARHGHEDYVYSILTGYYDPPVGEEEKEDMYWNAYFPGNWIGMAPPLYNEIIEYSDGTPAVLSQLAKDVVTYLRWAAEPEFNDRKRMFIKVFSTTLGITALAYIFKRRKWSTLKSRKTLYHNPKTGQTYK